MEKNMGFGLALGLWAVLKTVQPKLSLATFEGSFFLCFYEQFLNLNYYFSYNVCACFRLSVCLSVCLSVFLQKKFFRPKWIKFANSVNRHLEF